MLFEEDLTARPSGLPTSKTRYGIKVHPRSHIAYQVFEVLSLGPYVGNLHVDMVKNIMYVQLIHVDMGANLGSP